MKIKMAQYNHNDFAIERNYNEPNCLRVYLFGVAEIFEEKLFANFHSLDNSYGEIYLNFDNCKIMLVKDIPTYQFIARMVYVCPETGEEKYLDVRESNKHGFIKLFKTLLQIRRNNFNTHFGKPVFENKEKQKEEEKEHLPKSMQLINNYLNGTQKPETAKTETVPQPEKQAFLCGFEYKSFSSLQLEKIRKVGDNFTWIENGIEILFIIERYLQETDEFICAVVNCRKCF